MEDFEQVYQLVKGRTLISRERLKVIWDTARSCLNLEGEFWECGVFQGGSARLIAEVVSQGSGRTLRLFDSFRGLSKPDESIEQTVYGEGHFKGGVAETFSFLPYSFISVHAGWIPETFRGEGARVIAFAHLDLDLYHPTKDALMFILPRLVSGGKIVVDDYAHPDWTGVKKAVDESLGNMGVLAMPEFQAVIGGHQH